MPFQAVPEKGTSRLNQKEGTMSFEGRRVLVTGAGKGIGLETARLLATLGAAVVALSRSEEDLEKLKAEIGCETIAVDLADIEAARRAAAATSPIDLLVNCAGTTTLCPFLDLTPDLFNEMMTVNAMAPIVISQEIVRDMIKRGCKGAIVNVSSMAALVGLASQTAYCASKGALDAITRAMAVELGPHGIRVNAINPTVTMTPMGLKVWSDPAKAGPRLARIPLGRFAQPSEIAEAIVFLLGDGAAMINGVCLPVDGGFRAN
jgi:L-xylulose reductase